MIDQDATFEEFCNRLDVLARSTFSPAKTQRLAFKSINTTDGMSGKQVGQWTFDGRIFILNKATETGAFAGYEAATVPSNAPASKMISIQGDAVEGALSWLRWLLGLHGHVPDELVRDVPLRREARMCEGVVQG